MDRNIIKITDIDIIENKITYQYDIRGPWTRIFKTEVSFSIEYSFDVSVVPESIAIIPLLCNILPVAWICDAEVVAPTCDQAFAEHLPQVKAGYEKMYPALTFGGKISIETLEENHSTQESGRSAAFFSGGVDSYDTMFRHLNETPVLITLWGSDVFFDDIEGWTNLKKLVTEVSANYNLTSVHVKSSFRYIMDYDALTALIHPDGKLIHGWWYNMQSGMGIFGHAAPAAYVYGLGNIYVASSLEPDELEAGVPCASDPSVDNYVHFADAKLVHDGYEYSRQDKIHNIVTRCKREQDRITIHACWESRGGKNCCQCEKCWRTIYGLAAEGADPAEFGFPYTIQQARNSLKVICPQFSSYRYIQERMRANFRINVVPKEFRKFYKANLKRMSNNSQKDSKASHLKRAMGKVKNAVKKRIGPKLWNIVFSGVRHFPFRYEWKRNYYLFRFNNLRKYAWFKKVLHGQLEKIYFNSEDWKTHNFKELWNDAWLSWLLLGAEPDDYYIMDFPHKSWLQRYQHVTRTRMNFLIYLLNDVIEENEIVWMPAVDDKKQSYIRWNDYLGRKWIDPFDATQDEFISCFQNTKKVIVKPRDSYGGFGIKSHDIKTQTDLADLYRNILETEAPTLVEEYYQQKGILNDINPSSLNTIRVNTICGFQGPVVISACLRCGVGDSVVDNFSSGGAFFPIDVASGIFQRGMSHSQTYLEEHPVSHIKVAGEAVPDWDKIKEFCLNAHRMAPENARFIGWDICWSAGQIIIVEVNGGGAFVSTTNKMDNQWKKCKEILNDMEKNNVVLDFPRL